METLEEENGAHCVMNRCQGMVTGRMCRVLRGNEGKPRQKPNCGPYHACVPPKFLFNPNPQSDGVGKGGDGSVNDI